MYCKILSIAICRFVILCPTLLGCDGLLDRYIVGHDVPVRSTPAKGKPKKKNETLIVAHMFKTIQNMACKLVSVILKSVSDWVCSTVWPFKWKLWSCTFLWYCYYAIQGGSNFWVCGWNPKIQIKATEQYFPVVLLLCCVHLIVVLTFDSVCLTI